jgi:hypothetical protein
MPRQSNRTAICVVCHVLMDGNEVSCRSQIVPTHALEIDLSGRGAVWLRAPPALRIWRGRETRLKAGIDVPRRSVRRFVANTALAFQDTHVWDR